MKKEQTNPETEKKVREYILTAEELLKNHEELDLFPSEINEIVNLAIDKAIEESNRTGSAPGEKNILLESIYLAFKFGLYLGNKKGEE